MSARRYTSCSYCGSAVEERHIRIETWIGDTLVIFEDVPAGVCDHCGEEFLGADTQEKMFALVKTPPKKTVQIPVYGFTDPLTVAKAAAKQNKQDVERLLEPQEDDGDAQLTTDDEISELLQGNFEEWDESDH